MISLKGLRLKGTCPIKKVSADSTTDIVLEEENHIESTTMLNKELLIGENST